ncbi:hypothetical protein PHYBOEH_010457 [Phytophthora boehmeriae]|uniref:Elicitin n=1 Tax=Phytophthora boehmeriae TaxID=109152 RepID=A0A8T1VQL9_9STRA|nr:hypothetical protein PHYBOEH_010457 [Phytophthora boehmeriae]
MRSLVFLSTTFLLLVGNLISVTAIECSSTVSKPVKTLLDNGTLFSTCAMDDLSVQANVNSLFDVLDFTDRDFLLFCRSSSCIRPVQQLLNTIPTNCLIDYHGSAHNLSEEVTKLYQECAEIVGAADNADEEHLFRYSLDYPN